MSAILLVAYFLLMLHFVSFAFHPLRPIRASRQRGFTLIELTVVVVIIGIIAAMAMPSLAQDMKDRRARRAAEEIMTLYRDARMRAIGRGAAVLVYYRTEGGVKRFTVHEAVRGGTSTCSRLPETNCLLPAARWTTAGSSTEVASLRFDPTIKVRIDSPGAAATDVSEFAACFSPIGRTFAAYGNNSRTTLSQMAGVPLVRVYRTETGGTTAIGLERRIVLLPNGQARLEVSGQQGT